MDGAQLAKIAVPAWATAAYWDGRATQDAVGNDGDWYSMDTRGSWTPTWAFPIELRPGEGHPSDVMGVVVWNPERGVELESETRLEVVESLRAMALELGNRHTQLTVADRALWRACGDFRGVLLTGPCPSIPTLSSARASFAMAQRDARTYETLRSEQEERLLLLFRARVLADAWLKRVSS